jgi:hypothetical protein
MPSIPPTVSLTFSGHAVYPAIAAIAFAAVELLPRLKSDLEVPTA